MPVKMNEMPTKEFLCEHFSYCPVTGVLTVKKPPYRTRYKIGERVGSLRENGWGKKYLYFSRLKKSCQVHRAIWVMEKGEIPEGYEIDHIDGDGLNNRLENLRCVTRSENFRNRRLATNNTSGIVGVRKRKGENKWTAQIKIHGKSIHLGTFTTENDAAKARKDAERAHGFHENHGKEMAA